MTVYEKLAKARVMFQSENIKKSGQNKFAGYSYFELSDILPICNKICEEIKAVVVVSFTDTIATLDFVDAEKTEDKITFTSPMSKATLKGCHEVQNLGAVETYIKRYLYQNCFEIAENDSLDGTMNPNDKPTPNRNIPTWTKEQMNELANILNTIENGVALFTEEEKIVYRGRIGKGQKFELVIEQAKNELKAKLEKMAQPEPPQDMF